MPTTPRDAPLEGGCACGRVRYRLTRAPLIVHCCHCTWCQRETGSAFAVNALIETGCIELPGDAPEPVLTPSASGKGQTILRCPDCHVAVWSHYAGAGPRLAFIRAGTLDDPARVPPDIHIYTSTKAPWVVLPPGARSVPEFYDPREFWTEAALARRAAAQRAG